MPDVKAGLKLSLVRPGSRLRLSDLIDLVFGYGYDYFISYAHADGAKYPSRLAEALSRNYSVCFDELEHRSGEDLDLATRRRVRMSSHLVVVFGPEISRSDWVYREVEIAHEAGREIIVIDLDNTYGALDPTHRLRRFLDRRIRRSDVLGDEPRPSPDLLQILERDFKGERQERRRLRFFRAAFTVVFSLLIAVIASAVYAHLRAIENRDRLLVFAASQAQEAGDSTHAAAFLREVRRERLIPQWQTLAAQLATSPLPIWQSKELELLLGIAPDASAFVTLDERNIMSLRSSAEPWRRRLLAGGPGLRSSSLRDRKYLVGGAAWDRSQQLVEVQLPDGAAVWELAQLSYPLWTGGETCLSPDGNFTVLLAGTKARLLARSSPDREISSVDLGHQHMLCTWTSAGPLVGAWTDTPPTYLMPTQSSGQAPASTRPIRFEGVLFNEIFVPPAGRWIAFFDPESPPAPRVLTVVAADAPSAPILRIPLHFQPIRPSDHVLGTHDDALLLNDDGALVLVKINGATASIERRNLPELGSKYDRPVYHWSPDGRRVFVHAKNDWNGVIAVLGSDQDMPLPKRYLLPDGFVQNVRSSEIRAVRWIGSSMRLIIQANDNKAWLWDLEGQPDSLIPFMQYWNELAPVTEVLEANDRWIVARVRDFAGVVVWSYENSVHELNEPEWFDHPGDPSELQVVLAGELLITKGVQTGIRVWRLEHTPDAIGRRYLHAGQLLPGGLSALVYPPTDQHSVERGALRLIDSAAGGKVVTNLEIPFSARHFVLTPARSRLFVTENHQSILGVYDLPGGTPPHLAGPLAAVVNRALASPEDRGLPPSSAEAFVSPDGRWVLLLGDQTLLWSSEKLDQEGTRLAGQGIAVFAVDGSQLILVKRERDRATHLEQWILDGPGAPRRGRTWRVPESIRATWERDSLALAHSGGGTRLAILEEESSYLLTLGDRLRWRTLPPAGQLLRFTFDPKGSWLLGITCELELSLWDLRTPGSSPIVLSNIDRLRDARFSAAGGDIELLVGDGAIRTINLSMESLRRRLDGAHRLCATPAARRQYLRESPEEAAAAWRTCYGTSWDASAAPRRARDR